VPPAQLALATILQAYTGVSDDEVIEATMMDRRWQLVLDSLARKSRAFQGTLMGLRQPPLRQHHQSQPSRRPSVSPPRQPARWSIEPDITGSTGHRAGQDPTLSATIARDERPVMLERLTLLDRPSNVKVLAPKAP
jgi:hypothetical protein